MRDMINNMKPLTQAEIEIKAEEIFPNDKELKQSFIKGCNRTIKDIKDGTS